MQSFFIQKTFIVFIIFFLSIIAVAQDVSACSVGPNGPPSGEESYERSDVVFVGTVESVKRDQDINGNIYITFMVNESYKGVASGTTVEVTTGGNSAMCGYDDMNVFGVGSVWSIYASGDLYTTSVTANEKYTSVAGAIADVDVYADVTSTESGGEVGCIDLYAPVCGQVDTGIRCVTTPCPSFEQKTFSNTCYLEREEAVFLHEGECKDVSVVPEPPLSPVQNPIPNNCQRWYDGCNWCNRSEVGGPAMCTKRACFQQEASYCEVVFAPTQNTIDLNESETDSTTTTNNTTEVSDTDSVGQVTTQTESGGVVGAIASFFRTMGNFFKNLF